MKKTIIKKIIIIIFVIVFIFTSILLYSRYIGTSGLFINEYKIKIKNLSNDFYGFKIVHISDIHYGNTVNEQELNNLVKNINLIKPDIVVLTGDLIDMDNNITNKDIKIITKYLKKIESNIGKYAIKGNHDYNFKEWELLIENSDFINLNENSKLIYGNENDYILLSGLSTNIYGESNVKDKFKILEDFIKNQDVKPNYSILLMHEPDFIESFNYSNYNLILAGHSHNGQIRLPFIGPIMKPIYGKKYYDSYYKLKNSELFVSNGIGTSKINYRLFNRPTINLYRLTNK